MKRAVLIACFIILGQAIAAQELYTMPRAAQSRVSSFENLNGKRGAGGITNRSAKGNAAESLKAGESKTLLDVESAGIINRMWFTISDRSFLMLRSLRLRMYWDGAAKPAVDVPFGDFFCASSGKPVPFQSALFSSPEGRSFNCYIQMPFKKGAKVMITNENSSDLSLLFYDIDFLQLRKVPKGSLYFHAYWNRSISSVPGKDFEILPFVKGKGRFLGTNIIVNTDSLYGNTWWGEGEVKMYLDGDSAHPTINGTGAEDYIGTGWGEGTFTHLYQGCTVASGKLRQYAFYRFHVPDPIFFYKDCKVTIQEMGGGDPTAVQVLQSKGVPLVPVSLYANDHLTRLLETPMNWKEKNDPDGWVNFYRVDDYAATAYFYLDKPENDLPELEKIEIRTVIK